MKRRYYLLLTIAISACFTIFAIENERNKLPSIIGTWVIHSYFYDGKNMYLDDCFKQSYYVFSDKKFENCFYSTKNDTNCKENKISGLYIISENILTFIIGNQSYSGSYHLEGDTLTINTTDDRGKKVSYSFKKTNLK